MILVVSSYKMFRSVILLGSALVHEVLFKICVGVFYHNIKHDA